MSDVPALRRTKMRWWVLALLVLTTTTNLMDRQLPFIMVEPIRKEFSLSDGQIGLMGGLAFSLVYALCALPLARLADRGSRTLVLAGSLATWSLFTGMGGLATSFPMLLATRTGVALGEAGALPASHSLISDLFQGRRRAFALALNTAGVPLGVLLGMAVGGLLLSHFHWRSVLLLAAAPGLVLAGLFALAVPEPERTGAGRHDRQPSIGESLATLSKQRSFLWLTLGATLTTFATAGGAAFGPSFFMRGHGLPIGQAGLLFGVMLGLSGLVGSITAGLIAQRRIRTDQRWLLWIPAIGALIQMPLYCASWVVASLPAAIAMQSVAWFAGSSYLALSYAAVQAIAIPRMRAISSAVLQLALNLIGNVLGPIAVGGLSDALRSSTGQAAGLGDALAAGGALLLGGAFAYWRAAAAFPSDIIPDRPLLRKG
jgi:predicted MFS family arabinose efflux permease